MQADSEYPGITHALPVQAGLDKLRFTPALPVQAHQPGDYHCPQCGSGEYNIAGYRPNKANAQAIKLRCKQCDRLWSEAVSTR